MDLAEKRNRRVAEAMFLVVVLGMSALYSVMGENRLLALNLFYLPVILAGFYLGRFNAGVLALFSVLAVTIATLGGRPQAFAAYDSPVMIGLALTLWSAVLGLAAILVGTLCDERAATVHELQRAYVGIAEVLSKYLQGSDPKQSTPTGRVAQLSQQVAEELKLPPKQVDDVRVAALLHDLGNIEITTQTIARAVGSLDSKASPVFRRTFLGTDLVHSLGDVLHGALPLLVNQNDDVFTLTMHERGGRDVPLGAHIIRAARTFDRLTHDASGGPVGTSASALRALRADADESYQHVIDALERVVRRVHRDADARPPAERFDDAPPAGRPLIGSVNEN